ncbi:MAG: hypothetical protein ACUVSJ_08790 [Anaerolineae bacterium]
MQAAGVTLITILLLELSARLLWWQRECLSLQDRMLCLLPLPILTAEQRHVLDLFEQREREGKNFGQFDAVLGWSIRPNSYIVEDGTPYESNEIGVRAKRSYALIPPLGVTRIAIFGPSFAHADDVALPDSWPYLLESSRADLEVMNWGVGGYGTDQAFLRYTTQGAAYKPHIVIIVYEEDNLRRNVNRYRPFVHPETRLPLTKPVFILDGDGLLLLENPFRSLSTLRHTILENPTHFLDQVCPHDFFCVRERYEPLPADGLFSYRVLRTLVFEMRHRGRLPYLTSWQDSYADPFQLEVTLRLLTLFAHTVRENGSTPIVLVCAYRPTFEEYAVGNPPMYQGLIDQLRRRGIPVLDLAPEFVAANQGSLDFTGYFAPGGHYNEVGNRIVSQAVLNYLCQEKLLTECPSPS